MAPISEPLPSARARFGAVRAVIVAASIRRVSPSTAIRRRSCIRAASYRRPQQQQQQQLQTALQPPGLYAQPVCKYRRDGRRDADRRWPDAPSWIANPTAAAAAAYTTYVRRTHATQTTRHSCIALAASRRPRGYRPPSSRAAADSNRPT